MVEEGTTPAPAPAPSAAPAPAPDNGDPKSESAAGTDVLHERPQLPPDRPTVPPAPTDPKTFFKGTSAMDRLKGYLKDVPIFHARLVKVVDQQVANLEDQKASLEGSRAHLAASQKALQEFDDVTAKISATVDRWEDDEAEKKKKPTKPTRKKK